MVRIKSPGCSPALSAGLSGITSRTHPYIFGIGLVPRGTFILSVGARVDDDGWWGPLGPPASLFIVFKSWGEQTIQRAGGPEGPHPSSTPPPPLRIIEEGVFLQ